MMHLAIANNRASFVRMFTESGFLSLTKFLTNDVRLKLFVVLYQQVSQNDRDIKAVCRGGLCDEQTATRFAQHTEVNQLLEIWIILLYFLK